MSDVSPTGLGVVHDDEGGERTLIFSSRLLLAANTTLQLTLLFAYLYLRANNFGGMWHPSGVNAPPEVLALASLVFPVVGLVALVGVSGAVSRGRQSGSLTGLLGLAVLAAVLTGAVRILLMYQFSWTLNTAGTYADIATLWYAVLLAEFIIVSLWMLSLVMGHIRGTAPITRPYARALLEHWAYVTGFAVAVYLLVEFVT
jgi:hypothetical protein